MSSQTWIGSTSETLGTPQSFLAKLADGSEMILISRDRPHDPKPWGPGAKKINLHSTGDEYYFYADPSWKDGYGTPVTLGPRSAGRFVATDPILEPLSVDGEPDEFVVNACRSGAEKDEAISFADELFKAEMVKGQVHFPTDTSLGGGGTLPDGSQERFISVVSNYDANGNQLPLWLSVTEEDVARARAAE
ncbi:MAG: hypothetical protein HOQ44_20950 [Nocardia sp.]|nr:hypothetical protein [Nocardia sp.]